MRRHSGGKPFKCNQILSAWKVKLWQFEGGSFEQTTNMTWHLCLELVLFVWNIQKYFWRGGGGKAEGENVGVNQEELIFGESKARAKGELKWHCCLVSFAAMKSSSLGVDAMLLATWGSTWKEHMELSNQSSLVTSVPIVRHRLVIWEGTRMQNVNESDTSVTFVKNHSPSYHIISYHIMLEAYTRVQQFPAHNASMKHPECLLWETTLRPSIWNWSMNVIFVDTRWIPRKAWKPTRTLMSIKWLD